MHAPSRADRLCIHHEGRFLDHQTGGISRATGRAAAIVKAGADATGIDEMAFCVIVTHQDRTEVLPPAAGCRETTDDELRSLATLDL